MAAIPKQLLTILLLLAVLSFHARSMNENPAENSQDCIDFLSNYLQQQVFKIPDQKIKYDSQTIKFLDISIFDIDVEYLKISYLADPTPNDDSIILKLQLNNLRMNATIDTKQIPMKVKMQFIIENFTLFIPLKFYKGSSEIYESVELIEEPFYSSLDNFSIILPAVFASLGKKYVEEMRAQMLDMVNNETALYDLLNPLILQYGKQLFEKANKYLNSIVNHQMQITIPIKNAHKFIPIIQSPIVDILRFFLNDLVSDSSCPLNLNNLVSTFKGNDENLTLTKIGEEFKFDVPVEIDLQPSMKFTLDQITVSGIDTWSDMNFLNPSPNSHFILNSTSTVGKVKINVSSSFNFEFDGYKCSQPFNLSFELFDNKIDLGFQIAAPIDGGLNYTNDQFFDLMNLVNLVDKSQTGITTLRLNTAIRNFDYKFENGFGGYLVDTLDFLLDFVVQKNLAIIPRLLNGFLYESVLTFDLIEKPLHFFNETHKPEIGVKATIASFSVAIFIAALFCILTFLMAKFNGSDSEILSKFCLFFRSDDQASLFMHPQIPLWIRLVITVFLFSDIALFLSSDASIGASLFLKVIVGEAPTVYFPSLYDFDFITIVSDMWAWKSYFLSILLFLVSVLWPLVKLILMLIVWILPMSILKVHKRSIFLRVLDELGKWSLLDSFVLIVMFVAFRLEMSLPIYNDSDITSPIFLSLWFYPEYGFITLILATLISSVLSNIICFLNRRVKNGNRQNDGLKKAVFRSQNFFLNILLIFLLCVSIACFSYGICSKSVRFYLGGYAGWFAGLIDRKYEQKLSVIELLVNISKSSENPNSFAIRITQFIFFLLLFVVPYLHMISLFFLLLLPMKRRNLTKFYYASRTVYSWSCIDVFSISLFISIFVIDQMSVLGPTCVGIHPLIKNNFKKKEMCFCVVEKVINGSFVLLCAAVCYTVVTIWINVMARKLSKDENSDISEENLSDASLSESDGDGDVEKNDK